ncbi:hypothetical protein [Micromonospora carbonacea]|uniref:Lipoprotein n=1 Tax=Micromonospora carbonacea TaxID=47853 RepID=A0A1C5AXV1_9ACTN|nr:hypothetical protein [Micromonospora carbonacea]SCF50048.1 hypothetical protein GA0070563_12621 [Micromonospora carbonacea]
MRIRSVAATGVVALLAVALGGCGKAPYDERMKYLDGISQHGIDYRVQLFDQKTEPSKEACEIGYDLLKPNPPADDELGTATDTWRDQVKEAYIKSCMTGELKPKPDVDGVDAVTPVPITARPVPSVSASPAA